MKLPHTLDVVCVQAGMHEVAAEGHEKAPMLSPERLPKSGSTSLGERLFLLTQQVCGAATHTT
jgi:hypothetical protein